MGIPAAPAPAASSPAAPSRPPGGPLPSVRGSTTQSPSSGPARSPTATQPPPRPARPSAPPPVGSPGPTAAPPPAQPPLAAGSAPAAAPAAFQPPPSGPAGARPQPITQTGVPPAPAPSSASSPSLPLPQSLAPSPSPSSMDSASGWQPQPPTPYGAPFPLQPPAADPLAVPLTPGGAIGALVQASLRRGFRLRADAADLLPAERVAVATAPELTAAEPSAHAFLAWRRSILLVVTAILVPLVVLRIVEIARLSSGAGDSTLVGLSSLAVIAEAVFAGAGWLQLRRWIEWRRQRPALALAWAVYFFAPFVVFLYPFGGGAVGVAMGAYAVLALASRLLSIGAGVVRGALAAKLLAPASPLPGWLVVAAAPVAALLAYVVLLVPYQATGSGYFALAILALGFAAYLAVGLGRALARPQSEAEAIAAIAAARKPLLIAAGAGALLVLIGLAVHYPALFVINLVLGAAVNVLALTALTADVLADVVGGPARAPTMPPE